MKYRFILASVVSLVVCLVFLLAGDGTDQDIGSVGFEYIVLQYFHALTWGLLALFFFLWHQDNKKLRDVIGFAALAVYTVFLFATFMA